MGSTRARWKGSDTELGAVLSRFIKNPKSIFYNVGKGARRSPRLLLQNKELMNELRKLQPKPKQWTRVLEKLASDAKWFQSDPAQGEKWVDVTKQRLVKMCRDYAQGQKTNAGADWVLKMLDGAPAAATAAPTTAASAADDAEEDEGDEDGEEEAEGDEEEVVHLISEYEKAAATAASAATSSSSGAAAATAAAANSSSSAGAPAAAIAAVANLSSSGGAPAAAAAAAAATKEWIVEYCTESRSAYRKLNNDKKAMWEFCTRYEYPENAEPHHSMIAVWKDGFKCDCVDVSVADFTELLKDKKYKSWIQQVRAAETAASTVAPAAASAAASSQAAAAAPTAAPTAAAAAEIDLDKLTGCIWSDAHNSGAKLRLVMKSDKIMSDGTRKMYCALLVDGKQKCMACTTNHPGHEMEVKQLMMQLAKLYRDDGCTTEQLYEKRDELLSNAEWAGLRKKPAAAAAEQAAAAAEEAASTTPAAAAKGGTRQKRAKASAPETPPTKRTKAKDENSSDFESPYAEIDLEQGIFCVVDVPVSSP